MKEEIYLHPNYEGYKVTMVTLSKGERHSMCNDRFISFNAGHVMASETPYDFTWTEYDRDDEWWRQRVSNLKENGWLKQ